MIGRFTKNYTNGLKLVNTPELRGKTEVGAKPTAVPHQNLNTMFIVIETFDPTFPSIATNEDGYPLLFDTEKEAQKEADDCQMGVVVEI